MRLTSSFACVVFVLFTNAVYADKCPGPNTQQIKDAYFNFTYESWVRPPAAADSVFSYGRCIQVIDQGSVRFDWDKTQLKGLASPDQPILITLPFAQNDTVSVLSNLGWGLDNIPKFHRAVQFMANEQEIHPSVAGTSVAAKVGEWQTNLSAGKPVPEEVRQLRTAVSLVLPDTKGAAANYIYVLFESDLSIDGKYIYKLYYYGMNGLTFYEAGSLNVSFSSPFLSKSAGVVNVALLLRGGSVTPSVQEPDAKSILKRYFPEGRIEKDPTTHEFSATGSINATMNLDVFAFYIVRKC